MSEPKEPIAHGDRRREVWIEDDPAQKTKVRHTWPAAALREEGIEVGADEVIDVAVTPDEPSVWEAVEDDD